MARPSARLLEHLCSNVVASVASSLDWYAL
jgi:hypothetical protein